MGPPGSPIARLLIVWVHPGVADAALMRLSDVTDAALWIASTRRNAGGFLVVNANGWLLKATAANR